MFRCLLHITLFSVLPSEKGPERRGLDGGEDCRDLDPDQR